MNHSLTPELADAYLELICAHAQRPYPWSPGHLLEGPEHLDAADLHPAFHGSLDWHSCVHSHWALYRLLGRHPDLPHASAARQILEEDLTPPKLAAELDYLRHHPNFERPYGWVWLLQLALEAREPLAELESHLRERLGEYLSGLLRPVRIGLHTNTAFAMQLALDYARRAPDRELGDLCRTRALEWFVDDRDYPARLEPLGSEFLSAGLSEAALMGSLLEPDAFATWLDGFLPGRLADPVLEPVAAGGDAHLYGFDLSRAWAAGLIAAGLPPDDQRRGALQAAREKLLDAGLAQVGNGDYMADHWLATFALLALEV